MVIVKFQSISDTIGKIGGNFSAINKVATVLFGGLFYKIFLRDFAWNILKGNQRVTEKTGAAAELPQEHQVSQENVLDDSNWFHKRLLRTNASFKDMRNQVIQKIRERFSFEELFFLYDRVEHLEQVSSSTFQVSPPSTTSPSSISNHQAPLASPSLASPSLVSPTAPSLVSPTAPSASPPASPSPPSSTS